MGTAASVLDQESTRPLDGADINTPRGESAKAEVIRLRALLAENYTKTKQDEANLPPLFTHYAERIFLEADVDQSGFLDYNEFWRLLQEKMNLGLSNEDIDQLKSQMGIDSEGNVSWQQLLLVLPGLLKLQLAQCEASDADWCELTTETGDVYYYNKRTQESVWDNPSTSLPLDMVSFLGTAFEAADTDKSGYLNWDEFWTCLRTNLQFDLNDQQIYALQQQVVVDPEKGVSWNDFIKVAPQLLLDILAQSPQPTEG